MRQIKENIDVVSAIAFFAIILILIFVPIFSTVWSENWGEVTRSVDESPPTEIVKDSDCDCDCD